MYSHLKPYTVILCTIQELPAARKWEKGQIPTKDNLERIAEYYHITVEDLISKEITYSFLDNFYKPIPVEDYKVEPYKIFLMFTSQEAENNEDFNIAKKLYTKNFTNNCEILKSYENLVSNERETLQYSIERELTANISEILEDINSCRNHYYRSFKNNGILAGAANTLSMLLLGYLFTSFSNIPPELIRKMLNNQASNSDFSLFYDKTMRTKNENCLAFVTDNYDIYMECLKALRNNVKTIDRQNCLIR